MARVVDFEDGFTSETAPTDNNIATQAELDAHINDTTAVHAATSLSLPVTETLYVDKGRADTYTQTGSILAPYKTIQAAINAIQTAADNSDSKPYRIEISAGYYAEDLVISGAGFINVILDGHGAVTVDKLTMSVADAFWTFVCLGMSFADSVSIIGTTDGGTAFASGGEFRSCNFYDVTLKNLCAVYVKDSAIGGPLVVENVISAAIQKGQATGSIANTWAPANPKPGGAPYSYLNLEALVTTGDITISAGAYVQTRIGSRIGLPGGTITVNGEFIAYSSYIRAGISVGATGVFTNSGSFYDPSTLSVAGGGTVTKNSKAEVIANVPTGNLAATNVQAALDELQTDVDTRTVKATLTTKGDLYVATAAATLARQGIGTNGQVLVVDSTQTNGLKWGNAPQGLKNYIVVNADLEQGSTTGYSLGTATLTNAFPSGAPTFGSGAAGTLSLSAISSGQLAGTYSLGYTSSAATTAGNFVATDAFTVDLEGQAKVMQFKIAYSAVTNPTNGNFSGTSSNSFGVAIYDVTNSAWIQPAGVFNIVQSSGVGIASGTFQTTSNSTSYRLVFFNANASAGAITMYLDDFFVGPQITAAGAAVSDWSTYTPTITSGGTTTTNSGFYRRVGDSLEVSVYTVFSGAGAASSLSYSLPSGLSIDTAKLGAANRAISGSGSWYDASITTQYEQSITHASATTVGLLNNGGSAYLQGSSLASGDQISFYVKVPIVGWSSNTVMSNDTDTRVVAAQLGLVTNYAVSANAPIKFDTVTNDTHAGYSASTGLYTVSVPGYYRLSFTGLVTSSTSGPYVAKNGVAQSNLCSVSSTVYGAGASTVKCVAGDTLGIYSSSAVTFFGGTAPAFNTHVSIERISGPATVAATESVVAQYGSSTATSFASNGTIFNFDTREIDSHSAVTTGASWKFTAPVSGTYEVSSKYTTATAASSAVDKYRIQELFKNGSTASKFVASESSTTTTSYTKAASGSTFIYLLAGEYIDLRTLTNDATAHTLNSSTSSNWISIRRVGN